MISQVSALVIALQAVSPGLAKDRLNSISTDMVDVIDAAYNDNSIKSVLKRDDAISLLAAVAVHESGLRESVETCKVSGDMGRSIGLTQVMSGFAWGGYTRKEICTSRKLQLKLGLQVLDTCWLKTPDAERSLRCYASGDHRIKSLAARSEFLLFKRLSKIFHEEIKKSDETA